MRISWQAAFVLSLWALTRSGACAEALLSEKKIIKLYGWDCPTTAYLREHVGEMERVPFDGVGISAYPNDPTPAKIYKDPHAFALNFLWFSGMPCTREDYSNALADLKATKFERFTDNFLRLATRGKHQVDWFDERWPNVVENGKVAAWLAREGGLKGITLDIEMNGGGTFNYAIRPGRASRSSAEYAAQVRKCGREWMEALVSVYPNITVILTQGYSVAGSQAFAVAGATQAALETSAYGLFPAFLDGMLEGAGDQAVIVDGCENSYPILTYQTFLEYRREQERDSMNLCSVPELYRKTMRVALALYPGFRTDAGSMFNYADPSKSHCTPEGFEHALYNAMTVSDRYVWVANWKLTWWPISMSYWTNQSIAKFHTRPWPQAYVTAMGNARKPHDLDWNPRPPDLAKYPPAAEPPASAEQAAYAEVRELYEPVMDLPVTWWFRTSPDEVLLDPRWSNIYGWFQYQSPSRDEAAGGWQRIRVGECWERQGYPYDGAGWYRVSFQAPESAAGKRLFLAFGGIAGHATVYVGERTEQYAQQVAENGTGRPFMVDVAGFVKPGKESVVAVRVLNSSGPGGITRPVELVARKPARDRGKAVLLHLEFDGKSTGIAHDSSGNENHGKIHGAKRVPAPFGAGLEFDGVDDYVDCGNDPGLDAETGQVSWEVWFKPGEEQESGIVWHILAAKHAGRLNGLYMHYRASPNRVAFKQAAHQQEIASPIVDYGTFHHMVATYDGTRMALYVDGTLAAARDADLPPPINEEPLLVGGGRTEGANRFAKGIIDEVAVYNWALDAAEVKEKYTRRRQQ